MNLVDVLNGIWSTILQVTSLFVIPDWGMVIGGLPVVVVLGLVAPFMTFLAVGTVIYQLRKPRVKVRFEEGPRVAEIGADAVVFQEEEVTDEKVEAKVRSLPGLTDVTTDLQITNPQVYVRIKRDKAATRHDQPSPASDA